MKHKIIAVANSSPLEAYFNPRITDLSLIVCETIDDAINNLVFLDAFPVNSDKKTDAVYYIKSINGFVFSRHDYLFPLFRYMQHTGVVPKTGNTLINWDAHSDFYYTRMYDDSQDFERWGKIQPLDWTDSPIELARKTFDHSRKNIGIASFIYPLLWDQSITQYIWRDYTSHDLFNRLASKLLGYSGLPVTASFYYSDLTKHYFPPFYEDASHLQINRQKTIEVPYLNASRSTFEDFSARVNTLTGPIIHTVDVDLFFNGSPSKRFQPSRANGFQKDMDLVSNNPSLYPVATLIATSPSFSNPKETEKGVKFILDQYRFLEQ